MKSIQCLQYNLIILFYFFASRTLKPSNDLTLETATLSIIDAFICFRSGSGVQRLKENQFAGLIDKQHFQVAICRIEHGELSVTAILARHRLYSGSSLVV